MATVSADTGRRVGLLINRKGGVETVLVGGPQNLILPNLETFRYGRTRLKGLRLVHTYRSGESLSGDDLTDLALLRLDFIAGIHVDDRGEPENVLAAHLLPKPRNGFNVERIGPMPFGRFLQHVDIQALVESLEEEFSKSATLHKVGDDAQRALLVSVGTLPRNQALERLQELAELAETSGLEVVGTVIQSRKKDDPRTLLGKGKLSDIAVHALQLDADLLVFSQDLNPAQVKHLTDTTELRIVDRTQLILDIFAQRARTREGKIQVELAQLKYMLPRLVTKNTAMSRLTGGIGGRGPGETKLEINRRRARERIQRLQSDLEHVRKQRRDQRKKRLSEDIPIVAIVGYTNAGKSTLLNTLTRSDVFVQNRLFATLDPTSRRLKFPRDREIVLTDTVGFIDDLPKDLLEAFRATLEQLEDAHLLIHLVDISNPRFEMHIEVVEHIIEQLDLDTVPRLLVLNKEDLAPPDLVAEQCQRLHALSISANHAETLRPLIGEIEHMLWPRTVTPLRTRGPDSEDASALPSTVDGALPHAPA